MGNWISRDSHLNKHACSARNITWQYIHNNGSLPTAYADCPESQAILHSHCCREGRCYPYFLDIEFQRATYNDWDGLGSPYMPGEEKGSYWSFFPCKIMWGEGEHHDHIIGVDGKRVKNESTCYPTNEVDIKGNDLRGRGLMRGPDMSKHRPWTNPNHPTGHRMAGHNTHHHKSNQPISDAIVSSLSPESTQQAITGDLRPWTEWTDPYQEESNAINDGLLVAGIVIGLVVGIIVVAALLLYLWEKAQKNNWFSRLNNWFSPVMPRRWRRRNNGPWDPRSEEEIVIEDGIETYRD